jgi:hypothetical protein
MLLRQASPILGIFDRGMPLGLQELVSGYEGAIGRAGNRRELGTSFFSAKVAFLRL